METTEEQEFITGNEIALDARAFNTRYLYMTDEMHDALVLFEIATHMLHSFTTVPRGLAVSPKKQAGKSTWLKSLVMLSWMAWKADPTSFALRSKFNDHDAPFVIIDEIEEYYGKSGLRQGPKDLNKILLEGYENDAALSLSVDRVSVDVASFCFAAMGGLRAAVRDDIWDRCIVWKMSAAPAGVELEDALSDDIKADGKIHQARIHQWAMLNADAVKLTFRDFKRPHKKMRARLRQIWGPLYAVALVLGEDWPERCIAAFKAMALDASEMPVLSGEQRIIRDVAAQFASTGADRLFTRDIADYLRSLPTGDDDYYNDLSDRGLAMKITAALGPAQSMDIGTSRAKGYHADPVLSKWKRLDAMINPPDEEDEETDEFEGFFDVVEIPSEVTEVTEEAGSNASENGSSPGESRSSRSSRNIGTDLHDDSKSEPELSLVQPPCEDDAEVGKRARNVKRRNASVEDKFLLKTLKEEK